ncbi:hypothetical protein QYE76_026181 [Lolium multiflorum]|uniref:Reverse transcriptase zinc-binding domain-containing protein n=1 Tax=Lolium multiflorum TaxID=4521 RepID=A0AAD8RI89_LOLMU|nr:hypothetical protein QYE76_026181 [Lolium multiflorum]
MAARELIQVLRIIDDTSLAVGADGRVIDSPSGPAFSSREAYRMLSPSRPTDASACTTWALRLPAKLKIFAYLADIDRLSTRANLFYKHCAPSSVCAACPEIETGRHLFFYCPPAMTLWGRLGVSIPPGQSSIWTFASSPADPWSSSDEFPRHQITVDKDVKSSQEINPAYDAWVATDQQVLLFLLNTLSPDILISVIGMETAVDVWGAIKSMFASQSKMRISNLCFTLAKTKRRT